MIGKTKTSQFNDFWICEPRGTLIYGFEYTKKISKHVRKVWRRLFDRYFYKSQNLEHENEIVRPDLEKMGTDK